MVNASFPDGFLLPKGTGMTGSSYLVNTKKDKFVEEPTLSLSELLAEAAAAAGLGDRVEAERLYRRATNRSPGNSQAWLGLAAAAGPRAACSRSPRPRASAVDAS